MQLLLFLAGTIIAASVGASSIKIVKQGDEALVEFLGRYDGKKLEPGLNFVTPFISHVVCTETKRERVLEIPPQNCITRDNVSITVDAVVYWQVMDIEKAYYRVQNLQSAMVNLVLTQIRAELGKLELNQTFTARTEVNEMLLRELDISTEPWGVKVRRVELRDIVPSKTVQGAMELQMSAERKKQATILTSEGDRESAINTARGKAEANIIAAEARHKVAILDAQSQKQQQILKAAGTAEAMDIIAKKLKEDTTNTQALQYLLVQNYLEMGLEIGSSESSKVLFMDPRTIPATLDGMRSLISEVSNNEEMKV
ncbi:MULTISPECIES: SPFH domain-containing protein [unclassified Anabaena]|uniref:SPFH domain-containing protein n=1 Tax=unclassified Anabaena TaxID=2619674 RepID=UPI0014462374|nr:MULTISPECIES: SPFH domain-containing protein [unclassified Anabaena]MTJ08880.1 SPFH/Band 7/PHB domain protein [Anabaena sp. UHCC 0204]MTJ51238.1 SPFH/Band 7/PHB domain protein [Anabaena sp. UHCC 0253]